MNAIITIMVMEKNDHYAALECIAKALVRTREHSKKGIEVIIAAFFLVILGGSTVSSSQVGAISDCDNKEPLNLSINADASDSFTGWARVKSDAAAELWLAQDGQCVAAQAIGGQTWNWVKFDRKISLNQGSQVAGITAGSQELWLDKLLFTVDTNCIPIDEGDNCVLESMHIDITGVEQEVAQGVDLRIAAQVHGSDKPAVSFTLDDQSYEGTLATSNEALYCAVESIEGICGVVHNSKLRPGAHALSVSAKDGDRISIVNLDFTVTEVVENTALESGSNVENKISTIEARHSTDEQPNPVKPIASKNVQYADLNKNESKMNPKQGLLVPTFVIGQGSVLGDTLSGEVGLSVPASMIKNGDERITYKVDGKVLGTISASELPYLVNTADFDNHGHQFEAHIVNGDGVESMVEVAAVVNNSPYLVVKSWVATRTARIILTAFCLLAVVLLLFFELRRLAKTRRIRNVTGVNIQAIGYVKDSRWVTRGYGVLAIAVLTTIGAALLIAPATPAYSGNASVTVQPEDERINYLHETGSTAEISSQYVILR